MNAAPFVVPETIDDAYLFTAFLEALEADPLKQYRHSCDAARKMVEACRMVTKLWTLEVYWRAGNSSGKPGAAPLWASPSLAA
jgi:hypothetical protein